MHSVRLICSRCHFLLIFSPNRASSLSWGPPSPLPVLVLHVCPPQRHRLARGSQSCPVQPPVEQPRVRSPSRQRRHRGLPSSGWSPCTPSQPARGLKQHETHRNESDRHGRGGETCGERLYLRGGRAEGHPADRVRVPWQPVGEGAGAHLVQVRLEDKAAGVRWGEPPSANEEAKVRGFLSHAAALPQTPLWAVVKTGCLG